VKKAKKKGLHPAVAVGFLVLAGGFAAKTMFGAAVGPAAGGATVDASAPVADPAAAPAEQPGSPTSVWQDLLAVHGSFDRKTAVRVAFSTLAELKGVSPAPFGETVPGERGRWTGEDPPTIHVGVVMVSAASRRAVIDGRVVGIGDKVGNTVVAAIERDVVILQMGERQLTYDFDNDYPREFRAEQALREQEGAQQAADEAAAAANPAAAETKAGDGKTPHAGKTAAKKPLEEGK